MSVSREARGLFDHGRKYRLEANGFGGTNTNSSFSDWLTQIRSKNDPSHIEHNFFHSQPTLMLFKLQDGSQVSMLSAGNPYGPLDSLTAASNSHLSDKSGENLSAWFADDLSYQTQYKYWQVALAELLALERLPAPNRSIKEKLTGQMGSKSLFHPVIAENLMPLALLDAAYISDTGYSPRTSRTIAIRHVHTTLISEEWLKEAEWSAPHLDNEQQFLRSLQETEEGKQFLPDLQQTMQEKASQEREKGVISTSTEEKFKSLPSFSMEKGLPVGYSLSFRDISPENLMDNIEFISAFMRIHEKSYREAVLPMKERIVTTLGPALHDTERKPEEAGPIGLPAYRDYITFTTGENGQKMLTIRFAPAVFSHGGVMEAAGIEMIRGRDIKDPLDQKTVRRYRKQWAKEVDAITKTDTSYEVNRIPYRETILPRIVKEKGKKRIRRINKNFSEEDFN